MGVAEILSRYLPRPVRRLGVLGGVERANRLSPLLSNQWERDLGVGQTWMPLSYGEYYPRSALVYSAIKVRQDAVARAPLRVYRRLEDRTQGARVPHPLCGTAAPY